MEISQKSILAQNNCLWRATEKYSELLNLNRKYIDGKLLSTRHHEDPLDKRESKPGLLSLHDYELLTTNSQSNKHEWVEKWNRPFLEFLLPRSDINIMEAFCEALCRHPKIVTWFIKSPSFGDGPNESKPIFSTNNFGDHSRGDYNLSKTHAAESRNALIITDFEPEGRPKNVEWKYLNFDCVNVDNCCALDITVAGREWIEFVDLSSLIRSVAIASGMKPIYSMEKV
jgi:hypothetical protein